MWSPPESEAAETADSATYLLVLYNKLKMSERQNTFFDYRKVGKVGKLALT